MAVRIRMKRMGRAHRPFYRICAMDSRCPRDGKAIEELGYYDPMVKDTDARAILNGERIAHWISVGALPTEKVAVLIKKYGKDGTHRDQQAAALERLKTNRPQAPAPYIPPPKPKVEEAPPAAEEASSEPAGEETSAEEAAPTEATAPEATAEGEASS